MGRVVFVATSEAQAQMVRDLLVARGIGVELSGAWRAALRGVLPIAQTSIAIEAFGDDDAERARAALEEIDLGEEAESVWSCPRCGEEVPGGFDVCWKCGGAAEGPLTTTEPLGARMDAFEPRDAVEPTVDPRTAAGDLLWVIGAGCLPVALTALLYDHALTALGALTAPGRVGLVNLVAAVELGLSLLVLRRRGVDLAAVWGGRERWASDLSGGIVLGLVAVALDWVVHVAVWRLGFHSGHLPALPAHGAWAVGFETVLLFLPGVGLAVAAGSVAIYGIVLPRLRALLRSSFAAVALVAVLATLTWTPGGAVPALAGDFAVAILLGSAFLLARRARPIAIAMMVASLVFWLPALIRRG
jgi:hypothetical protein